MNTKPSIKLENLSIAKIVTLNPGAVPLFEKNNLDYCCHGKKTLTEILKDNPNKLADIKKELNILFSNTNIGPEINFDSLTLSELIDYIINVHHRFVKEQSPLLINHTNKIAEKHGGRHPELIEIRNLFAEIKNDFDQHMIKEENILFPAIRNIENSIISEMKNKEMFSIDAPISVMESEHEKAGNIFDEIRRLTNNYTPPADACTTYRLTFEELKIFEFDLHKHVHLENNILFPKAIAMQSKTSVLNLN